jgi:predicted acylesterase/phospholipase RssA
MEMPYIYMEIVMSGAGTIAPMHVGAMAACTDNYVVATINIGTSAGAMVAALKSLGMKDADIKHALLSAKFSKLIPYNYPLAVFRKYLASNKNVIAWYRELTNDQCMKDCTTPLITVTSDLTTQSTHHFDSRNPDLADMPVWQAVIPSMSIPGVFPPFNGVYEDGGVMDNLAVNYLPQEHPGLALRITEATSIGPVRGFVDRMERTVGMMLTAAESDMVAIAALKKNVHVIALPAGHVSFLDRTMSASTKLALYDKGYNIMSKYLQGLKKAGAHNASHC